MTSRAECGLTLVELLIALAIAGMAASAVVLTLPASGDALSREGARLAAKLRLAGDLAVLRGHPIGLELTADGYRFVRLEAGDWRVLDEIAPLAAADWSAPSAIRLDSGETAFVREDDTALGEGAPAIRFDAIGLASPFTLRIARGGRSAALSGDRTGKIELEARDG